MTGTTREPVLAKGDRLGERWEIIEHIATGGKGEVYRARQTNLDREVAIKIVSPELIEAYEGDQEEIDGEMARFRREVLAMARARHPNVLTVFDYETAVVVKDGRELTLDYIVMEYVPGQTLSPTIPEDGLRGDEAAFKAWITAYFLPILDGVEHIHRQGIIHRDLKPGNVLLDGDVPRITDFGLVGGRQWEPVTRSHHIIGTLAYMAPEQYQELADTDFRADVYSLGKILYHAAEGKLGKGTMYPLQMAGLPDPDTPFLKALDRVIRRATAKDRNQRLPSVAALRNDLLRLTAEKSPGRGRRPRALIGLTALALVLAGLLAAGLIYHFREQPRRPAPGAARVGPGQLPVTGPPPSVIKAADGAALRLVPAGKIKSADGREKAVPRFYLDETRVTNHQYVEFLNANLSRIKVSDGLVKGDGRPWLYLGELRPGVEPIVFRGGRFRITDTQLTAHPVYRVTAHGAAAYAAHYGRRLPHPAEWRRAASERTPAPGPAGTAPSGQHHGTMHGTTQQKPAGTPYRDVSQNRPNKFGLKGLGPGGGEWVAAPDRRGQVQYGVMAAVPDGPPRFQAKQPWQSFAWVGFRCARSVGRVRP